jgi:hypothetical protein
MSSIEGNKDSQSSSSGGGDEKDEVDHQKFFKKM